MIFVGFISALAGSGKDQRYQLAERLRSLSPQPVAHRSAHSAWLSVPTVALRDQEDCTENGAPVPARRWAATHPVEGAQARRASCDFSARPERHRGDAVESSLSLPCCRNSARQWEPRGRLALQRTWEKAVSAPARQGGVGSSATLSALQGVYHRALGARLEETQSNRCDPKALLERGDTAGKGLKPARRRRFSTCGSPGRVPPAQLADC